MAITATHVYFTGGQPPGTAVVRVPRAGGDNEWLNDGQNVRGLAADDEAVYWVNAGSGPKSGSVVRWDASDRQTHALAAIDEAPITIAIDKTHVYWLAQRADGRGTVQRLPKAGGTVETVVTDLRWPLSLALDGSHVYFTAGEPYAPGWEDLLAPPERAVLRVRKTGGRLETVAGPRERARDVLVDDRAVYWTRLEKARAGGEDWAPVRCAFRRGGKAGARAVTLDKDACTPGSLIGDGANLYWLGDEHIVGIPRKGGRRFFPSLAFDRRGMVAGDGEIYWRSEDYLDKASTVVQGRLPEVLDARSGEHTCYGAGTCERVATGVAVDGDTVYWTAMRKGDGFLLARPKAGGATRTLARRLTEPGEVVLHGNSVCVFDHRHGNDDVVLRVPRAGGRPTIIAQDNDVYDLVVEGDRLLFLCSSRIFAVPIGGGPVVPLIGREAPDTDPEREDSDEGSITAVAIDGQHRFWTTSGRSGWSLWREPRVGGKPLVIHRGSGSASTLIVDDRAAYVSVYQQELVRVPKAGGVAKTLASGPQVRGNLAQDETRVYWALGRTEDLVAPYPAILRVSKDGGAVETLTSYHLDPRVNPTSLAVDATHVYFVNGDSPRETVLMRVSK